MQGIVPFSGYSPNDDASMTVPQARQMLSIQSGLAGSPNMPQTQSPMFSIIPQSAPATQPQPSQASQAPAATATPQSEGENTSSPQTTSSGALADEIADEVSQWGKWTNKNGLHFNYQKTLEYANKGDKRAAKLCAEFTKDVNAQMKQRQKSMAGAGMDPEQAELYKKDADEIAKQKTAYFKDYDSSIESLQDIDAMLSLFEDPNVQTGLGYESVLPYVSRILQGFGANLEDTKLDPMNYSRMRSLIEQHNFTLMGMQKGTQTNDDARRGKNTYVKLDDPIEGNIFVAAYSKYRELRKQERIDHYMDHIDKYGVKGRSSETRDWMKSLKNKPSITDLAIEETDRIMKARNPNYIPIMERPGFNTKAQGSNTQKEAIPKVGPATTVNIPGLPGGISEDME